MTVEEDTADDEDNDDVVREIDWATKDIYLCPIKQSFKSIVTARR